MDPIQLRQLINIPPVQICLGANAHIEEDNTDPAAWGDRQGCCGRVRVVEPATDIKEKVWVVVRYPFLAPSQGDDRVGRPARSGRPKCGASDKPMRGCRFHNVGRGLVGDVGHWANSGPHKSIAKVPETNFGPDQGNDNIAYRKVACP